MKQLTGGSIFTLQPEKFSIPRIFTFTAPALALAPGHEEVGLLPELVALTEVAAKFVLVLHHVPGDAEAHGARGGRGEHAPGQPVLATGVVVAGLKMEEHYQPES